MDALALLCTLHADGPASLKRLRARGCDDIRALVVRGADDVADALDVEPAVARRLLREARLLVDRIGPDALEPEEAPPAVGRGGPGDAPPVPAAPAAPLRSDLDAADRALVARLSRPAAMDAPAARETNGTAAHGPTESAVSMEPAESTGSPAESIEPAEPIARTAQAGPPAEPRTAQDERRDDAGPRPFGASVFDDAGERVDPAVVAAETFLAGHGHADDAGASRAADAGDAVDEDLLADVEELVDAGLDAVPTADLEQDANVPEDVTGTRAESSVPDALAAGRLAPGRPSGLDAELVDDLAGLGIETFDDLAAAESLELTRALGITFAQARRLRFLARRAAQDEAVRAAAAPLEPAPAPVPDELAAAPAVERTPPPAPVAAPEPIAPVAEVDPAAGVRPSAAAAVAPRTPDAPATGPATEPATGPAADPATPLPDAEPQGVRVDPAEIEARPRFGESFARAAAERAASSTPGRTVLGWNFEIPRPEPDALPLASISPGPAPAEPSSRADAAAAGPEEDTAGPFAHA